jgi:hypothetical protein
MRKSFISIVSIVLTITAVVALGMSAGLAFVGPGF